MVDALHCRHDCYLYMNEIVLGFQLRVILQRLEKWDLSRRETYLLRDDIPYPLSVDESVWPMSRDETLHSKMFIDYFSDKNAAPNGLKMYTIRDEKILKYPSAYDGGFLIVVTAIGDAAKVLRMQHHIQHSQFSTERIEANGWQCLGYDVADYWMYSGLMNCGYNQAEKVKLSNHFGSYLNSHGLFNEVSIALNFCEDCDSRVPGHSPFAVFGIWKKNKSGE